jgi:D-apiose dehydrogenase
MALSFAMFGAGFWARPQLAAWREVPGARCVAICDPRRDRAEALARAFDIPAVYDDAEQLLAQQRLDFVDVVTDVHSHVPLVDLATARGVAAICQKPMAPTWAEAQALVRRCADRGVPFFVHENWRHQTPLREVHRLLAAGRIGTPFRARIQLISAFPVFDNQPSLKTLEQFIITDLGSHLLDAARFLFGEMDSVYARTGRVHAEIKGEDVATICLGARSGATVLCEMAYAGTPLERDRFPETYVFIEGDAGSLELAPDHWVRLTTRESTLARRCPPPRYAWADPAYDLVQSSMVACHSDLLRGLRGEGGETSGRDNLETVRLVFASYESAARNSVVALGGFGS